MVKCFLCSTENAPDERFCSKCGSEFAVKAAASNVGVSANGAPGTAAEGDTPSPTEPWRLGPPKRTLLRRPWTSDWVFWLFIVVAGLGGTQSLYRTGQTYASSDASLLLIGGSIDVISNLLIGFVVFALIPALIRLLVWKVKDKRAFAAQRVDVREGWKPDPVDSDGKRWWNGNGWTRAVLPEESKAVGALSWWVLGGLFVVFTLALVLGRASVPSVDAGNTPMGQSTNPNAATAVALYYGDLMDALSEYSQTPVDAAEPEASMVAARAAFEDVETNYILLRGALPLIASQEELGEYAPDLGRLQEFVDVLQPYVQTRLDYYNAMDACGPMTADRLWGACEFDTYEQWERPMVDTIPPVAEAFDALVASLPERP